MKRVIGLSDLLEVHPEYVRFNFDYHISYVQVDILVDALAMFSYHDWIFKRLLGDFYLLLNQENSKKTV